MVMNASEPRGLVRGRRHRRSLDKRQHWADRACFWHSNERRQSLHTDQMTDLAG